MAASSQGRTRVLFTRAEPALVERLDEEVKRRREPGRGMTRSDLIRSILWSALVPRPQDDETPQPEAKR